MTVNPFEPFLQFGDSVNEITDSYHALVARNSPTPLYLSLPTAEQEKARNIAQRSQIKSYTDVLHFGLDAQEDVKAFANHLFSQMKRADSDKINTILHAIVTQLQQIEPDQLKLETGGFFKRLFKNKRQESIQQTISFYKRLSKQVDRLAIELKHSQQDLLREDEHLNELYIKNKQHFMHINVFIAAIELKLQELRDITLPNLQQDIAISDDMFMQQSIADLQQAIEWLDRRKYDLEISREITMQAVPQIRTSQLTNRMLMEKINSSVLATIPLWQTQISTILSLGHQTRLQQTERRLEQISDQMIKTNMHSVHHVSGSYEDNLEDFKQTQNSLVTTILDVVNTTIKQPTIEGQAEKKMRRFERK